MSLASLPETENLVAANRVKMRVLGKVFLRDLSELGVSAVSPGQEEFTAALKTRSGMSLSQLQFVLNETETKRPPIVYLCVS